MTHPNDELDPARVERLLEDVARLPREVAPRADAWLAIRQRIEAQRVRAIAPDGAATNTGASRASRIRRIAAAAAVAIGAGTWLQRTPRAKSFEVAPAPVVVSLASANPSLAAVLDQYAQASRELEAEVARHAAGLSPSTREVVRRSLATIDTAIADLHAALGGNPRDAGVGQSLSLVYERKLEFLRRVRALPAAGM